MTTPDLPPRPLRVAVLCEDDRVRDGLRHMLISHGDAIVVESYAGTDRPSSSAATIGDGVDVVVVDVQPGQAAVREQPRELRAHLPALVLGYDEVTARAPEAAGDGWAGRIILVSLAMFTGPWVWWGARIAEDHGLIGWHLPQGLALWTITPMLAAAVLLAGGRAALADLGRRIVGWRVRGWVWGAALLTPLAIAGVAAAIVTLLGGQVRVGEQISLPAALVYLGYGTGLFLLTEEAGWRGVLLSRLQTRLSPLSASLLVGVVWAVWHLPLLVSRGEGDPALSLVPFSLLVIATSVLLGALFNAAHGGVLVAAFFHASFDATYSYFGVVGSGHAMLWATVAVTGFAAVVLAITSRGRLLLGGASTLHPQRSTHSISIGPIGA